MNLLLGKNPSILDEQAFLKAILNHDCIIARLDDNILNIRSYPGNKMLFRLSCDMDMDYSSASVIIKNQLRLGFPNLRIK